MLYPLDTVRNLRAIAAIFFLGCCLPVLHAQHDPNARQLLDALYEKYVTGLGYRVSFSYEMASPIHSLKETLQGYAVIKGAQYIIYFDTTQLIHDGNNTWNVSLDTNEAVITNDSEEDSLMSVRNLMGMYKKDFKYRLLPGEQPDSAIIELVPALKDKAFFKVQLLLRMAVQEVAQFVIFFKDGQRYTLSLNKPKPLLALQPDFFTFKPAEHKGVEIIDLR